MYNGFHYQFLKETINQILSMNFVDNGIRSSLLGYVYIMKQPTCAQTFSKWNELTKEKSSKTYHIVEIFPFNPNHFSTSRHNEGQTKHNNNKNTGTQIFTKTKFSVAQTHREPNELTEIMLTSNIYFSINRKLPTTVVFPIIHSCFAIGSFYRIIFLFTLQLFLNIVTTSVRMNVCLAVS